MVDKEVFRAVTVYGSALVDQTTSHGIVTAITSTQISNIVICGITLGGWATILIFLGTLLLFIMNVSKFVRWSIKTYHQYKVWKNKRKLKKE